MNSEDVQRAALLCEAIDHRQFERLDDAEACLDQLLALDSEHVPALNEKGLLHMAQGHLDEAIECFERILAEAPEDPYALNRLGATYRQRGNSERAIACFERGLETNPYNTHILAELALTHHKLGHHAEAAHYFKEAERYRNFGQQISGLVANLSTRMTPGVAVAGLAHEINSVLDMIMMNLDMAKLDLEDETVDKNNLLKQLEEMGTGADRIHRLVVHFGKKAWQDNPKDDLVPIEQVIQFAFDLMHEKLEDKGIGWEIRQPPEGVPPILCNQLELEQVFVNLLSNSYEALSMSMERDPRVWVDITTETTCIEIRFSDNGPGIPLNATSHIFDFYYSTKSGGTGIGLWLCAFAIERTGGRIELDMSSGDKTTFCITLPAGEETNVKKENFDRR